MILGLDLLDLILLVIVIIYAVMGWRKSFLVSLGGVLGFVAGGAAAFFAVPLVSSWIPDPGWRIAGVVASFIALLAVGHGVGEAIAATIRGWLDRPRPRWWGRLGGAGVHLFVTAILISALAATFSPLGLPSLSSQIAGSKVVAAARLLTPPSTQRALGSARNFVAGSDLPQLLVPLAPTEDVEVPKHKETATGDDLDDAQASVARVTGTAVACGVNQTGSSFVVAPDRVMTNAHVVQGVTEPVVETQDGRALTGKVVSFDPDRDIAVLAVDDLDLPDLDLGRGMAAGQDGVFMGYPGGGPFSVQPAAVQSLHNVQIPDIYDQGVSDLEVYQLAANVQQGNSGGPLLDSSGDVQGLVFAKAADEADVGYALSSGEISAAAKTAGAKSEPVDTGKCQVH